MLAAAGLRVAGERADFANRLVSPKHLDGMLARVAGVAEQWLARQAILPAQSIDVPATVRSFFDAFLTTPFQDALAGSRFNKLLWLAIVARALRPTLLIDSGTYRGASAWALSFGAPDVTLLSFDPDLSQLQIRVPNGEYVQSDWTQRNLAAFDLSRSLVYFDDHVDQVRRVLESKVRGIAFALFDDDLPLTCFASMAPSPASLPKLEFLDDPLLAQGDIVEWTWRGARRQWRVDADYLAHGRAAIKAAERLPDFGPITGVRVWPPKLVAL